MKRHQSPLKDDESLIRRPRLIDSYCTQVQSAISVNPNISMETLNIPPKHEFPVIKETKVKLYWGRNSYDIDVDLNEPLDVFKTQILNLTNVYPDRQHIIIRGRIIKEDMWPDPAVTEGCELIMVGTNETFVVPVTVEEEVKVNTGKKRKATTPQGLVNHGNTCYMNSVLQIIRNVPELKILIINSKFPNEENNPKSNELTLINVMGELFKALEDKTEKQDNVMKEFIANIENIYPEYKSSLGAFGRPQQDANEFFVRLMTILKRNLDIKKSIPESKRDAVELLFGVDVEKTVSCNEDGGEAPSATTQTELQLSCFISQETKFLLDGIKSKFLEELTKQSYILNKEVKFKIQTEITRLPSYVCVQFVRFCYKEKENINAKIMRDVKFPLRLDLNSLCSKQLKDQFKPMVTEIREFETKLSQADADTRKTMLSNCENGLISLPEQKMGDGDSGSGLYNLIGVLTHKGRSSSEGHYVGWVKYDDKKWAKLDDDKFTISEEEDILKLSGGGDFHCAYLLIYQAYKLPKP